MNIYFAIGLAIIVAALCAGSAYEGRKIGIEHQATQDQAQFDAINAALTKQKADAAVILSNANAQNIALAVQRDALKTSLEKAHAAAQIATNAIHTQLAGSVLRFRAEGSGCGTGSGGAQAAGTDPASAQSSALIQLPTTIASDLFELALDADRLKDDYAACYGYATQVK